MDFARKQLEKYGWTDGKGLGKFETGISQALKPKLKRSVTGIGHDPASEFNEHWWNALYDKAASNVEVQDENGKTKKIKTKHDFKITNNTWQLNQNNIKESKEQYSDYFVRKAVLTSGGSKMENVNESDSEGEKEKTKDVFKMTDEELFAACEGRTAHKGARHGLKALGKLARIAQQEQLLLAQDKYNGYSHSKKAKAQVEQVVEEITLSSEDVIKCKKKKKKRKRCLSNNNLVEDQSLPFRDFKSSDNVASVQNESVDKKSVKTIKDKVEVDEIEINTNVKESTEMHKKKKKRKNQDSSAELLASESLSAEQESECYKIVKKKKKKKQID